MIKEGQMTLIEATPYNCVKIEGSVAFLQRVGEDKRGRFRKMDVKLVPYIDENNQIVVPKPPPMNRKKMTRFHFMKVIKDEVDLPVSHDLAYFVAEQLESFVSQLAICAEKNAKELGHNRITSAHWYGFNLNMHQGYGYWPDHVEAAKDYKLYLREKDV